MAVPLEILQKLFANFVTSHSIFSLACAARHVNSRYLTGSGVITWSRKPYLLVQASTVRRPHSGRMFIASEAGMNSGAPVGAQCLSWRDYSAPEELCVFRLFSSIKIWSLTGLTTRT